MSEEIKKTESLQLKDSLEAEISNMKSKSVFLLTDSRHKMK